MDIATTTAAPESITIRGQQYLISPLSLNDQGIMLSWVRQAMVATVRQGLEGLTPEQTRDQLNRVFDRLPQIHIMSPEARAFVATVDGQIKLTWCHFQKHSPHVTEAMVREWANDPEIFIPLQVAIAEMETRHTGEKKKERDEAMDKAIKQTQRKRARRIRTRTTKRR